MIIYERRKRHILSRLLQTKGSVFPPAICIAIPSAVLTALLRYAMKHELWWALDAPVLSNPVTWSGFSSLIGFLIVFRTSQAYSRFWEGCSATHMMRAEWFDACSSIIAFCKHSPVNEARQVKTFQHLIVRLFSVLHAVALAEFEDVAADSLIHEVQAFRYELLDAQLIDIQSLQAVRDSDTKVELVFQWIQQLVVENISSGVLCIPPPILSRCFQELANGMVYFHDAIKLSNIPFPFPYAQLCEYLLLLHWILTPFVVAGFASEPHWAAAFSFISVMVLWGLNLIAVEIENPFGVDANDIDASCMQLEFNKHLTLLLSPVAQRTPHLAVDQRKSFLAGSQGSLIEIWECVASVVPSEMNCNHKLSGGSVASALPAKSFTAQLKRQQSMAGGKSGPLTDAPAFVTKVSTGAQMFSKMRRPVSTAKKPFAKIDDELGQRYSVSNYDSEVSSFELQETMFATMVDDPLECEGDHVIYECPIECELGTSDPKCESGFSSWHLSSLRRDPSNADSTASWGEFKLLDSKNSLPTLPYPDRGSPAAGPAQKPKSILKNTAGCASNEHAITVHGVASPIPPQARQNARPESPVTPETSQNHDPSTPKRPPAEVGRQLEM